eukprot:6265659-Heterocapsa_arctica.AAC.1
MPGECDGDDGDFDGRGAARFLQLLGGSTIYAAAQNARDVYARIEALRGVGVGAIRGVQLSCRNSAAGTSRIFHFVLR